MLGREACYNGRRGGFPTVFTAVLTRKLFGSNKKPSLYFRRVSSGDPDEAIPMMSKVGSARVAPMDTNLGSRNEPDGKPAGITNVTTRAGVIAQVDIKTGSVLHLIVDSFFLSIGKTADIMVFWG